MVFKKGHPDYRMKIEIGDHIQCKFCKRNFINEEIQRTHLLFAHGFLMPRCESKAYFSHLKKIEALRKWYHIFRTRINDRLYRENWFDYTKHLIRKYEYELGEINPYYREFNYQKEIPHFISKRHYERRALFNHNLDVKNFCFVKRELDKNGILIDV